VADESGEMVRSSGDGCTIRLRVRPKASREAILGTHGAALKVAVKEPPERGRANRAVCELLARALEVPVSSVSLIAGGASANKVVRVTGLDAERCRGRLTSLLGEAGRADSER
jgi:uncharacterized protein (TIGR00251 family)